MIPLFVLVVLPSVWSFGLAPPRTIAVVVPQKGHPIALFMEQRDVPQSKTNDEEDPLVQQMKPKWDDLLNKLKHMDNVENAVSQFIVYFSVESII